MRDKIAKFFCSLRYHHFWYFNLKGIAFAASVIPVIVAVVDLFISKDFSKNPEYLLLVAMYAVGFCSPFLLLGYFVTALLMHFKFKGQVGLFVGAAMAFLCIALFSGLGNSIQLFVSLVPAAIPCVFYFGRLAKQHIEPFY
jgi:hypothetical protein